MKCKECSGDVIKNTRDFGVCKECGKKYTFMEVYSRVVGYIRPVEQWNDAKQQEFHDRKLFGFEKQTFI